MKLCILDTGGNLVVAYPLADAVPLDDGWVQFDLSALDKTALLTIELRADDVCVLPPVRICISNLVGQTAAGSQLDDRAYALDSLVRSPNESA